MFFVKIPIFPPHLFVKCSSQGIFTCRATRVIKKQFYLQTQKICWNIVPGGHMMLRDKMHDNYIK